MRKRNLINEILEVKARNEVYSTLNLLAKIAEIDESLNLISSLDENKKKELLKYIPISIVACFQSYFRELIVELIDSGIPYSENIVKFNQVKNIKFDFEILNALKKKKFSSGEFIAHLIPCNSLNDFNSGLSILTQTDFMEEIKNIKFPKELKSNPFNKDPTSFIQSINRAFELRHIFSHEYAFGINTSEEEINTIYYNCKLFLLQIPFYFSAMNNPDYIEKTEKENIEEAEAESLIISAELDALVESIISIELDGDLSNLFNEKLFRESIKKWKDYISVKIDAQFGVFKATKLKFVYVGFMTSETKKKILELKEDYPENLLDNSQMRLKDNSLRDGMIKDIINEMFTE